MRFEWETIIIAYWPITISHVSVVRSHTSPPYEGLFLGRNLFVFLPFKIHSKIVNWARRWMPSGGRVEMVNMWMDISSSRNWPLHQIWPKLNGFFCCVLLRGNIEKLLFAKFSMSLSRTVSICFCFIFFTLNKSDQIPFRRYGVRTTHMTNEPEKCANTSENVIISRHSNQRLYLPKYTKWNRLTAFMPHTTLRRPSHSKQSFWCFAVGCAPNTTNIQMTSDCYYYLSKCTFTYTRSAHKQLTI